MMIRLCCFSCCCSMTTLLLLLTTAFVVGTAVVDSTSSLAFVVHNHPHHHSTSTGSSTMLLRHRTRGVGEEVTTAFGVVVAPSPFSHHSPPPILRSWKRDWANFGSSSDVSVTDSTTLLETAPEDAENEALNEEEEKNKKAKSMEVLVFGAKLNYTSEPFPANIAKHQDFVDFFERLETKSLLLGSGGKNEVTKLDTSPELLELWKSSCEKYYGYKYLPNKQDEENQIYSSESTVKFPGIKIITTVCSAVKVDLAKNDDNKLPSYDFMLIGENRRAEGPAPLIWAYNKLTGASNDCHEKGAFNPSQASARTHVSVIQHPNRNSEGNDGDGGTDSGEKFGFNFDMKMKIRVEFPRILIRLLPAKKEKVEEQMSASLYNAIQPDIVQAIAATRASFLQFVSDADFDSGRDED